MSDSDVKKDRILVSACLLGDLVRYDGRSNLVANDLISRWYQQGRIISICPEVAGGLSTPRPAAEIQYGQGADVHNGQARIITTSGEDVTGEFVKGANMALTLAQANHCRFALMAARSPSCGNELIYDGSFSGRLIDGMGATAALLSAHGIQVFNQDQLQQLNELLDS